MATKPKKVEIRSYNVGFGDCFLMTFLYAGDQKKHVLIDFGSTSPPADDPDLTDAAAGIERDCGGELHAVVATHRHKDHIGGFATNTKGTAAGDVIRKLADKGKALVIQPWTEDPDAPTDFTGGTPGKKGGGAGKGVTKALYLSQLEHMHRFAEAVAKESQRLMKVSDMDAAVGEPMFRAEVAGTEREPGDDNIEEIRKDTVATDIAGTNASKSLIKHLAFIGEDNVKNLKAVKNLQAMGSRHEYLSFGEKTKLEDVLPGVKVHVLGPPTIDQYDKIQKQRSADPDEFWMLRKKMWQSRNEFWQMQAANATRTVREATGAIFPKYKRAKDIPRSSRWFVRRLRGARAKQLLELVLVMDQAMNNTSVILLFEVGGKKLLFPGDAQIENWEYALEHPDEKTRARIRKLLSDVDFYKVGHHGSRNATPKTLWELFTKRSADKADETRLRTMISTK
ncbi:MAG TPA: MBL fold metallo-hydrolase, partial [Thermoanaerobaculia bacterium]|nr:MBL fold metallo-hydrolase [Thermoanaerobaculia bacterium]